MTHLKTLYSNNCNFKKQLTYLFVSPFLDTVLSPLYKECFFLMTTWCPIECCPSGSTS